MKAPARHVLLVLALSGCVTGSPTQTKAVWVRGDGSTPSVEEFRSAEGRCEGQVNPTVVQQAPEYKAASWAVRMVECMEGEGLFLVEHAAD